jgi:hypothetical protein
MLFTKVIKYFYVAITLLALFSPTIFSFSDFLPGIIIMWIFFLIFKFPINKKNFNFPLLKNDINKSYFLLVTLFFFIFYPFYISFYTGTSIVSSLLSIGSGISNYYSYQNNFIENDLGELSLSKLPFILGHGFLKFSFLYLFFNYFLFQSKKSFLIILCLISMFFTFILVGLSRGTSFEIFEIFNIILFSFVMSKVQKNKLYIFNVSNFFILNSFVLILVIFFMNHIIERYGGNLDFTSWSNYNQNSIIASISPFFAIALFSLYGYFTFGLHFTSTIFYHLWINSFHGFLTIFFRDGIQLFGISISYREYANSFIDVGAQWTPDIISLFQNFGLLGSIIFVICLGYFSNYLLKRVYYSVSSVILLFFLYFYMISLPIGNFISVSSSNQICIILGILLLVFKKKVNGL